MVGVLSQKYPHMVPELMAYQATIVKCSRDFEGLAWARYDWAYRRQVAQTKDLRWSRLNPTLFSLCFAGKARRNITCAHCLSDNHTSDTCLDNPSHSFFWWQHPGGDFFIWAQFSRELARLYEYSYRPCAVCLLLNFVLRCNRRLVREVSRESKQVSKGSMWY